MVGSILVQPPLVVNVVDAIKVSNLLGIGGVLTSTWSMDVDCVNFVFRLMFDDVSGMKNDVGIDAVFPPIFGMLM